MKALQVQELRGLRLFCPFTPTILIHAVVHAVVILGGIAVVALLTGLDNAIAAHWVAGLNLTLSITAVPIVRIAVVTGFTRLLDASAADRVDSLDLAGRTTIVTVIGIAVVASFAVFYAAIGAYGLVETLGITGIALTHITLHRAREYRYHRRGPGLRLPVCRV